MLHLKFIPPRESGKYDSCTFFGQQLFQTSMHSMTFFAFGVNHETAPVRVREQISMSGHQVRHVYRRIRELECECVIISTCNRTEAYLFGHANHVDLVRDAISQTTGNAWPADGGFLFSDEEAVRHVLRVVAGLGSLVLGDGQIFSQMKDAYRTAVEEDAIGTAMHRLMHTAFRAAKRVISETLLTSGNASVAGAAVAVARDFFYRRDETGLDGKRAVVLGAGQMGVLAIEALLGAGVEKLTVANRTRARAERAAADSGVVVDWDDRLEAVADADVVIVATGASDFVLGASDVTPRERPLLIVDISVPRNVDPRVADVSFCDVIDLDALNRMLVDAERTRRDAVPAAEAICREELEEFVGWMLHHQSMQPAIHAIAATFDSIRRQEIERHAHRFSEVDRAQLERITESILQKLLAVPIVRLKSTDPDSLDFVNGVNLLRRLFSRGECEDGGAADPRPDEILGRLLSLELPQDELND